ncbi:MAG: hypothetical protein V1725_03495 [archaeon]
MILCQSTVPVGSNALRLLFPDFRETADFGHEKPCRAIATGYDAPADDQTRRVRVQDQSCANVSHKTYNAILCWELDTIAAAGLTDTTECFFGEGNKD